MQALLLRIAALEEASKAGNIGQSKARDDNSLHNSAQAQCSDGLVTVTCHPSTPTAPDTSDAVHTPTPGADACSTVSPPNEVEPASSLAITDNLSNEEPKDLQREEVLGESTLPEIQPSVCAAEVEKTELPAIIAAPEGTQSHVDLVVSEPREQLSSAAHESDASKTLDAQCPAQDVRPERDHIVDAFLLDHIQMLIATGRLTRAGYAGSQPLRELLRCVLGESANDSSTHERIERIQVSSLQCCRFSRNIA